MIMVDGIFVGFCESQVHGNERSVSHKHGFTHSAEICNKVQNFSQQGLVNKLGISLEQHCLQEQPIYF